MQTIATATRLHEHPAAVDWLTPWVAGAAPGVVVWLVVALIAGCAAIGLLGRERVDHLAEETVRRPDIPFAIGFVVLFVPFTLGSVLFVGTDIVPPPLTAALTAGAISGFAIGTGVFAVGSGVGIIAGGRAIDPANTASPWRALLVGVAVLGPLQFVPIAGTLLAVLVGVLGVGALAAMYYQRSDREVSAVEQLLWNRGTAAPASPVFELPFAPGGAKQETDPHDAERETRQREVR